MSKKFQKKNAKCINLRTLVIINIVKKTNEYLQRNSKTKGHMFLELFKLIVSYVKMSKPLHEATSEVLAEKLPTGFMICQIIFGLERVLQELVEISSNHSLTLAKQLIVY